MPKSAKNIKGEAKNVNLPSYKTKTCHLSAHNAAENKELQMDEGALRNVVREQKRDYVGKIPKLRGGV